MTVTIENSSQNTRLMKVQLIHCLVRTDGMSKPISKNREKPSDEVDYIDFVWLSIFS
jgi:hypothetical protein